MPGGAVLAMVPESLDDLVSTTEAANRIGVGKSTIAMWANRGHLKPSGLDQQDRPLYRMIDVLRAARDIRHRAIGRNRIA